MTLAQLVEPGSGGLKWGAGQPARSASWEVAAAISLGAGHLPEAAMWRRRAIGQIGGPRRGYVDLLWQGPLGGGIIDPDDFRLMPWGMRPG